jgi:hypothetical protein
MGEVAGEDARVAVSLEGDERVHAVVVDDYTAADCRQWMREIGFARTRVEHLAGPDSMVVGIK